MEMDYLLEWPVILEKRNNLTIEEESNHACGMQ
jgi:hypothetical protein